VYYRHRELYDCSGIQVGDAIVDNLPMNRFRTFEEQRDVALPRTDARADYIRSQYGVDVREDPRGLNYIRGRKDRYIVLFRNGDGLVFSSRLKGAMFRRKFAYVKGKPFNQQALAYIKLLAGIAGSYHRQAVFVIEPSVWDRRYRINDRLLSEQVKPVPVLFNAGMEIDAGNWTDPGHLNRKGVKLYTRRLYRQLKDLLYQ